MASRKDIIIVHMQACGHQLDCCVYLGRVGGGAVEDKLVPDSTTTQMPLSREAWKDIWHPRILNFSIPIPNILGYLASMSK